mgnify:CR=1 FL=1
MQNDSNKSELMERVIHIRRVSKTVKGGRNIRFAALVVVGDGKGRVGKGVGKSIEIPEAIRKGIEAAKRDMITIPLDGTTIPHTYIGRYGAGQVLMKPANPGTGVIAGGPVRAVMELAGVKDVRTKSLGSNNPNNVVNATMEGLRAMKSVEDVAKIRGKKPEEIL